MAYTENFYSLAWGGTAFDGVESWSNSTKLKQMGGDSPEPMQENARDNLAAVAAICSSYFTRAASSYNGGCRLGWVRLNVIRATTGRYYYPNDPLIHEFDPVVSPGGNVGVPQVAACVTLQSVIKRGPGARGRWYVPVKPSGNLASSGKISEATCLEMAGSAQTFLEEIAAIGGGLDPVVFIPWLYGRSETGPGADAAVQEVVVGNVLDTQRRRREQLVETYYGHGGYSA